MKRSFSAIVVLTVALCSRSAAGEPERATRSPEDRALAYLAREVPAWSPANRCFSCHNNGDAARALTLAARLGLALPAGVLDDTTRWLADPDRWAKNGGEGPFNDHKLARVQFAAALVEAIDAGLVKDHRGLARAAELVAELQDKDGSWNIGAEGGGLGHPATYGPFVATYLARRALLKADPHRYAEAASRATDWLIGARAEGNMEAAAVLLALDGLDTPAAAKQRRRCLELILQGQAKDGGWGPYRTSPPEPFDTALVLLALARQPDQQQAIESGRAYLAATQEADGSWPATTRPPGADSYAEKLSTTGWVTQALLVTRKVKNRASPAGSERRP